MVIAMAAVRMVQMAVHDVVGVIAVRDRLMAAIGAMFVRFFVSAAIVGRSASRRVGGGDFKRVLFDRAALQVVQVAVVQVIDVSLVHDARVSAGRTMLMRVTFMMVCHVNHLLAWKYAPGRPSQWHGPTRS